MASLLTSATDAIAAAADAIAVVGDPAVEFAVAIPCADLAQEAASSSRSVHRGKWPFSSRIYSHMHAWVCSLVTGYVTFAHDSLKRCPNLRLQFSNSRQFIEMLH